MTTSFKDSLLTELVTHVVARQIGGWWNFVDMPRLYDGSVVKADIWDV